MEYNGASVGLSVSGSQNEKNGMGVKERSWEMQAQSTTLSRGKRINLGWWKVIEIKIQHIIYLCSQRIYDCMSFEF